MSHRATKVLMDWLNRVNSGDIEGVLSMYSDDAVLLPTFSDEIRTTGDDIRSYFVMISSSDKVVVELDTDSMIVQQLTETMFTIGGIYSWLLVKGEEERNFLARFTYTIDINSDKPIIHHHSSVVPQS